MSKPIKRTTPAGVPLIKGIQPIPAASDIDSGKIPLQQPFQHTINVGWGDCDPAQIAYTANIPAWGLASVEAWYKACLGINWFELNLQHGLGTPFVSLNFQFLSPITGSGGLLVDVFVARMGNTSIKHIVEGYQNGRHCFTGETIAAFVDASQMKPIPVPANMRERIEHYITVQKREFTS